MIAVGLLFTATATLAAQVPSGPDTLPPKLEIRYQHLANELRCPVCQNEPIAVSDAVISADLRRIVREKLLAGESDQQIRDYMISRYGLFAVYKPPVARNTLALWFGPAALLIIALMVAMFALRRRRRLLEPSPQPSPTPHPDPLHKVEREKSGEGDDAEQS
ncbi:MAG: cytochrome c-type biogenesis protein [Gammaproteobacteria bacterium]